MQRTIRTTELRRSLKDRIKPPPRSTVNKETDQDALIEKAGSGLYPSTRKEEKSKEIVMDAEIKGRDNNAEDQEGDEDAVNAEVTWEAALEAEIPYLAKGNGEEGEDNDDKGKAGTGLDTEIGRSQPLDRDKVKGVVVERANPCATEPEDRAFEIGVQIFLLIFDAVAIEDCCDEGGGEEAADDEG